MQRVLAAIALFLAPFMVAATIVSNPGRASAQQHERLPAPQMEGGAPLMSALAKRRSVRSYGQRPLSKEILSNLLWAAFGVNRRDKHGRTAPSWRGSKEIDIYVATAQGVWIYRPQSHALQRVMDRDIRAATGNQPFPATAAAVLIYVADKSRMAKGSEQDHRVYAHVDSAIIAQNVYLFAASEGLGTVLLGNVDKAELAKTLKLRSDQMIAFTQPVGYPKQ